VTGCETSIASEATSDPRSYRVDFSKLERTFPDLEFAWDARRGATELMAAFEANGLTTAKFDGDAYVRLRRLKTLIESNALDSELRWTTA
jgi:hypothetical protein